MFSEHTFLEEESAFADFLDYFNRLSKSAGLEAVADWVTFLVNSVLDTSTSPLTNS